MRTDILGHDAFSVQSVQGTHTINKVRLVRTYILGADSVIVKVSAAQKY